MGAPLGFNRQVFGCFAGIFKLIFCVHLSNQLGISASVRIGSDFAFVRREKGAPSVCYNIPCQSDADAIRGEYWNYLNANKC